ncbi:addiction module toxin RelE [Xaviernesmea oryzae]|uniref:Addiction module toxin RelE n=1 Tax=Xaviernesmea oryzae TaxID=464029 RepID=A0A1Q9ARP0_9HYPH|nr:type II toxin-antitoxin system RelE/ParE family toxin [Xaviernesmea oryzae]OLP58049.1 addiction module toxin RelE [Xaviernesmea oryzae]SEL84363.1 mRNA interferase RelE/StbE [Xaviernesmea oryzae]
MTWTIEYDQPVQKFVRKLPTDHQKRIKSFLEHRLATHENPRQLGIALKGTERGGYWRYRVGDYSVICEIYDHKLVVLVIEIGHRREIYR